MSKRLERNYKTLKLLHKCKTKGERTKILKLADKDLIACLCECAHNLLKGNVKLTKKRKDDLKRHKNCLRELVDKRKGLETKRNILIQKGGLLPALLAPIISLAGGLVGELVGRLIPK